MQPLTGFVRGAMLAMLLCAAQSEAEVYAGWTVGKATSGYGTIMHTIDSGTTWSRQGSGQVADVSFSGVFAVDPSTAWVVGEESLAYATIYHTTNGGVMWDRKGFGQAALLSNSLGKVHVSSTHIWAVGRGAIVHSCDEGATWTNLVPAGYDQTLLQGVYSLGGTSVWVTGEGTNHTDYATILKSTDSGQTWTRHTGGSITQAHHVIGISAADAQTLWAVGGSGYLIYHSTNGGTTWTLQTNHPGGLGDANEVYAINPHTVWVSVDRYIGCTTNAGTTWKTHTTPEYTIGVCAVDAHEAWCSVDSPYGWGVVEHTADGGATWDTQISTNNGVAPLWTISFARAAIPEPMMGLLVICGLGVGRWRMR